MCGFHYIVYDHVLGDDDWDDGVVKTMYHGKGEFESTEKDARAFAKAYTAQHPGHRVSVQGWDCGGPCGDSEYFENEVILPKRPITGRIYTPVNTYDSNAKRRYAFEHKMRGRYVGQKQTEQRNELMKMMNLIETELRSHPDACECNVCKVFKNHIRDDKAKIDAELAGYRMYTKHDAEELDREKEELQAKVDAYETWVVWMLENFESLKVDGFAADVKKDIQRVLDLTTK